MLLHERPGTAIASGKRERGLRTLFKLLCDIRAAAAHNTPAEPLAWVARRGQSPGRLRADGDEPVPCARFPTVSSGRALLPPEYLHSTPNRQALISRFSIGSPSHAYSEEGAANTSHDVTELGYIILEHDAVDDLAADIEDKHKDQRYGYTAVFHPRKR